MQVQHYDTKLYGNDICTFATGILSFFFNITDKDNEFFNFLDEKSDLDLNKLVSPIDGTTQKIVGYLGSQNIPPCKPIVCWYLYTKPMTLSQKQFDVFSSNKLKTGNAREI